MTVSGETGLVMNYETETPIEDIDALTRESDEVWQHFREDVEKANLKVGLLRATHYDGDGMVRQGKGHGFVYEKQADGKWQRFVRDKNN